MAGEYLIVVDIAGTKANLAWPCNASSGGTAVGSGGVPPIAVLAGVPGKETIVGKGPTVSVVSTPG